MKTLLVRWTKEIFKKKPIKLPVGRDLVERGKNNNMDDMLSPELDWTGRKNQSCFPRPTTGSWWLCLRCRWRQWEERRSSEGWMPDNKERPLGVQWSQNSKDSAPMVVPVHSDACCLSEAHVPSVSIPCQALWTNDSHNNAFTLHIASERQPFVPVSILQFRDSWNPKELRHGSPVGVHVNLPSKPDRVHI